MSTSAEACAREVLEVIPLVMRAVRADMRQNRAADLTVPQFRTLKFLDGQPGSSLSAVAEHVGLALPSMSTLVEGLVERKLVVRNTAPTDRRRVRLHLTGLGESVVAEAHAATQARLAERLAGLAPSDRADVVQALECLRLIFAAPNPPDGTKR
jgi:DNA-binding MarR family transcriptional regulator